MRKLILLVPILLTACGGYSSNYYHGNYQGHHHSVGRPGSLFGLSGHYSRGGHSRGGHSRGGHGGYGGYR